MNRSDLSAGLWVKITGPAGYKYSEIERYKIQSEADADRLIQEQTDGKCILVPIVDQAGINSLADTAPDATPGITFPHPHKYTP